MFKKLCFAYNVVTSTILAILLLAVHYGIIDMPAPEQPQQVAYDSDGLNKLLDKQLRKMK